MDNDQQRFNLGQVIKNWESFRLGHCLFVAGFDQEYRAVWLRDNLYAVLAYYYLGDYHNAWATMRRIVDTLKWRREHLEVFHSNTHLHTLDYLDSHEPFSVKWSERLYHYRKWGHHQLDALGLFLYVLGFIESKGMQVIQREDRSDRDFLQHVVHFVGAVRYALYPDFGAWEECRHTIKLSSVGAVLAGLRVIREQGLATVPDDFFAHGEAALRHHLPYESKDGCERHPAFSHCCDANQLSLIWPFNIVDKDVADQIMARLIDGHVHDGEWLHNLAGEYGFRRYPNDEFWRSRNGVQGEWPMFFFFMSIIHSHRGEYNWAEHWFKRGCKAGVREGWGVELLQEGGWPNRVLNWTSSMAIIAFQCLSPDLKAKYNS